jgi:hypothetical protein
VQPIEELSEKSLVDLSSFISWRLAYERRAAGHGLFEALPPFSAEYELANLMWWQGIEATRLAPDLLYVVEENRKEIIEIVKEAKASPAPQEFLAYAQELQREMAAADTLLARLDNARR